MQRASPTRMTPVRYSGWSASSSHASVNINAGPTTQFSISEAVIIALVGGDLADLAVADLGQHRIHHQQQPERDGQRGLADLHRIQGVVQARDGAAEDQARHHGRADPDRE